MAAPFERNLWNKYRFSVRNQAINASRRETEMYVILNSAVNC